MQTMFVKPQITVFHANGYVNAANAGGFQRELATAVAAPDVSIFLLDMKQIEYIDSAGLMTVVSALNLAQSLGRRFIICSVSPAVRMIFELTQLDRVFEIVENQAAFEATLS
jgi:anti-sigma B factor antagonist